MTAARTEMRPRNPIIAIAFFLFAIAPTAAAWMQAADSNDKNPNIVDLDPPFFTFRINYKDGLFAESITNKLTGDTIDLGHGSELDIAVTVPRAQGAVVPKWTIGNEAGASGSMGISTYLFSLIAKDPAIAAYIAYEWNSNDSYMYKYVTIINHEPTPITLLNVRLGDYTTQLPVEEREQGFPIYINNEIFMSVSHPAGFANASGGKISLRHYPGIVLKPEEHYECMETVYGVAKTGGARDAFVSHVRSRMRRVERHHDKPYAIYDNFGSWPSGDFMNSESYELHSLNLLAESQKATGCRFDICNIHFWVDSTGDLKRFDPSRFPNALTKIKPLLDGLRTAPGLWIDSSTTWGGWGIGQSEAAKPSLSDNPNIFCRASEPIKSMYRDAFIHHIRENGIREIKFDNLNAVCNNPKHGHLPGVYSTEAIYNSVIELLHDLDKVNPDVFLILYWGHRSPWWLLHGDTLFDSGIGIEAATPAPQPAPFARDAVTQKLDQAQWYSKDIPALGKDSLGVWLSSWGWNSSIGKERWQEAFVMDISRGSLLAQIWADNNWLSPPEWTQLADFIALLRTNRDCFINPLKILGDPWKNEVYGYCCSDGKRAFLAINNCTWRDQTITLNLDARWNLPNDGEWDLVQWYPDPARLTGPDAHYKSGARFIMKPFEAALLEVVSAGARPSLDRAFAARPAPIAFAEQSRDVSLTIAGPAAEKEDMSVWTVLEPSAAASSAGAKLTIRPDHTISAEGPSPSPDVYTIRASTKLTKITGFRLEALADPALPSNGPGRSYNGNFAVGEFNVMVAGKPVRLQNPSASYSQSSYGGWPVAAAIDGDPKTAWSIDPREGETQAAVFETSQPILDADKSEIVIKIDQGYINGPPDHTLGRFRILATDGKQPIPPPKPTAPLKYQLSSTVESRLGGLFVISAELKDSKGAEVHLPDIGNYFTMNGNEGWASVLGNATYPSCWQAWRIRLDASEKSKVHDLKLSISCALPPNVKLEFKGHFVPN